ncbi:MAG: hypothetical protein LBV30_02855 [Propionibacteriaceae bacterium]|jgi:hypothetical protein|nr:hypothetical protein [Propionibacteriaceae bacterium]
MVTGPQSDADGTSQAVDGISLAPPQSWETAWVDHLQAAGELDWTRPLSDVAGAAAPQALTMTADGRW